MPLKSDARNDILPFAPEGLEDAGDLLPLEAYEGHNMRKRGHQAGLALRELQNRASRQSAHMAAGVAQFIANRHEPGVIDDADLDKVEEGLNSAILNATIHDHDDRYLKIGDIVPGDNAPEAHAITHKKGGIDPLSPADIGAAPVAHTTQAATAAAVGHVKPGIGMSVDAAGTLAVTYGTAASTACQGNDSRLSNARAPIAHASTHKAGGADVIAPADIGAAAAARTITVTAPLTGGGDLTANRAIGLGTVPVANGGTGAVTAAAALASLGAAASIRVISVAAPLTGGGDLTANRAIGINASSLATASYVIQRDAAGRAQVVAPSVAADIANKSYVDSALATLLPRGVITLWSGAASAVPSGWALCNGVNGTPNLLDRFIVGAGSGYGVGATGGATTHTHAASAANTTAVTQNTTAVNGATTLTAAQIPSHQHSGGWKWNGGGAICVNYGRTTISTAGLTVKSSDSEFSPLYEQYTSNIGSSGSHTHTQSAHTHVQDAHTHTVTVSATDNRPLYYALCYIMKL